MKLITENNSKKTKNKTKQIKSPNVLKASAYVSLIRFSGRCLSLHEISEAISHLHKDSCLWHAVLWCISEMHLTVSKRLPQGGEGRATTFLGFLFFSPQSLMFVNKIIYSISTCCQIVRRRRRKTQTKEVERDREGVVYIKKDERYKDGVRETGRKVDR